MKNILLATILCLLAGCGGSGGGDGSADTASVNTLLDGGSGGMNSSDTNSGTQNTMSDGMGEEGNVNTVSISTQLDGNYSVIAVSTGTTGGAESLAGYCNNETGSLSVYDGKLMGWVSGSYKISGEIGANGIVNAEVLIGSTRAGNFVGNLGPEGGSGTWELSGGCTGTWSSARIPTSPLLDGEIFTLTEDHFPAVLRVRFTPAQSHSQAQVACVASQGIVETNGYTSTYNSEIQYNGYALTDAGYRWDVDMGIDTDSGEVDGDYRYDPLGIRGSFDGDIYFAVTQRPYAAGYGSYDSGCDGVWEVTGVDLDFPARLSTENTDSGSSDVVVNDGSDVTTDATELPVLTGLGNTNVIPTCEQAKERILASVNPLMTQAEVRVAVGRPWSISGFYGTDWNYGSRSGTSIDYSYDDGLATLVEGYRVSTIACADSMADLQLIELANQLASQEPTIDYTDELPNCYDAASRILGWVVPGMSQSQVRKVVGKPQGITGLYGTDWNYGNYGITVYFRYDRINGTSVATTVEGYRASNIASCLSGIE